MASSNRFAVFIIAAAASVGSHASQFQELFQLAQANDPSYIAAHYTLHSILDIIPQANSAFSPDITSTDNESTTLHDGRNIHNSRHIVPLTHN